MIQQNLGSHFTNDSYGYYLIGKNIFNGFGFTSFSSRDFYVEPTWPVISRSWPPLHPFLVGLADSILNLGIRSTAALNLIVLLLSIVTIILLSRSMKGSAWFVVPFSFILFYWANPYYREELIAGRSIPLAITFYLLSMVFFVRSIDNPNKFPWNEILCGFCLCTMLHVRFDQTLFCISFLPASFLVYKHFGFSTREGIHKSGVIALVLTVCSLPWAIRNMIQFNMPFASNNSMAVYSTNLGMRCLTYWLPGYEPATIFSNPSFWLSQRASFFVNNLKVIWFIAGHFVYITPATVILTWGKLNSRQKAFVLISLLNIVSLFFSISLQPYWDYRYFSSIHINIYIIAFIGLASILEINKFFKIRNIIYFMSILALICLLLSDSQRIPIYKKILKGKLIPNNTISQQNHYNSIKNAFRKHLTNDDLIAIIGAAEPFTYYTGYKTIYFPQNMMKKNPKGLKYWITKWNVDYLIFTDDQIDTLGLTEKIIEKFKDINLIRV